MKQTNKTLDGYPDWHFVTDTDECEGVHYYLVGVEATVNGNLSHVAVRVPRDDCTLDEAIVASTPILKMWVKDRLADASSN